MSLSQIYIYIYKIRQLGNEEFEPQISLLEKLGDTNQLSYFFLFSFCYLLNTNCVTKLLTISFYYSLIKNYVLQMLFKDKLSCKFQVVFVRNGPPHPPHLPSLFSLRKELVKQVCEYCTNPYSLSSKHQSQLSKNETKNHRKRSAMFYSIVSCNLFRRSNVAYYLTNQPCIQPFQ